MFNKVSDFLQPKEGKETRAERRENARKAYRLAKKMRKDLERNPELKVTLPNFVKDKLIDELF